MIRTALCSIFLCILALTACRKRESNDPDAIPAMGLAEAIGHVNSGSATPDDLKAAEKCLAETLEDDWDDATGSGWESIGVLGHERGTLVFQQEAGMPQHVRVSLLGDEDRLLWKLVLELGTNFSLKRGELVEETGLDEHLVMLETVNENALDSVPSILFYAIGDAGCRLVWAENRKQEWTCDQLGACHPNLVIAEGQLASKDIVDQLVALVHLSQPSAKQQRHDSRVRSILETLAGSTTNNRLAEAAARVLTLP